MIAYSRFLRIFARCNFAVCALLTICGYIMPDQIRGDKPLNWVGAAVVLFSFGLMLVLMVIYHIKLGNSAAMDLIRFTPLNITLYLVLGAHAGYRLFFCHAAPGSKLMATLALSLLLNLSGIIMTNNYLKSK